MIKKIYENIKPESEEILNPSKLCTIIVWLMGFKALLFYFLSFKGGICKRLVLLLTFMGWSFFSSAQQISPILANAQVNPPYSSYLSDYASPGSTKLQVNLFLKDLTKTNYPCRLRIKIEGFGITIQNKNDFNVPALFLNGGELSVISGADLEPYFNPQNLVFQGLNQTEFTRNGGKLPEGIYRFTVEVIDYYRKSLVSNSALSVVSIFLAYPPIINQPFNLSKVAPLDPQNVVFQWTPRSTGSINAAYNIAYKFRLAEIIPADRNPNDAIRTSSPLYETFTDQTVLVYGLTEPNLIPGNSYAVQVQAVEAEGKDLFVNNGNSEVVKFTYGDKCASPMNIMAELNGLNAIKVSWNALPLQQAFTIRYRESNNPTAQWFEQEVYTPSYLIHGLRSSTQYEFQVKAQCIYSYGGYSELQTFKVPDEALTQGDFVCGKTEDLPSVEQGDPLPALLKSMVFFAGKFPVVVTEATGSNGNFSGTGTVGVPFLNALSFKVEFKNIRINTALKLTNGKVSFSRQTLEQTIDQVITGITVKPDASGYVVAISANGLPTIVDAAINWPGALPTYDSVAKTVKFTASVDAQTPKEITINLKEGQPPFVFQDKNSETFNVDKIGTVTHLVKIPPSELLAGASSTSYALNTEKASVEFLAPNQKYGFDAYQKDFSTNATYASAYLALTDNGKGKPKYYVGRKSIESHQLDEVQAKITITDKTILANKLEFKTGSGEKLSSTLKDSIYTINLIGALADNDKEIYAYHPDAVTGGANIGKLNISAFNKISKKVILVPVNGNGASIDATSIQDALNKIYKQAVVEWDVKVADNFDGKSTAFDNLETANSNVTSAYTHGQKALVKAYRENHVLEIGTYYIFLVKGLSDGSAGYMVRGGQVGFVSLTPTLSEGEGAIGRTIAHELGHGAFMLQHIWADPGLKEKSTKNLMDYGGGTELWYSQWKYMRNPDLIFRPFEGDDEGAYETDGHYSTVYLISLMLGMDPNLASKLAIATENPDTDIHSEMDFELDQTWIYPEIQQNIHSLTGGFHGVEEMMTAFKFLYTKKSDITKLGELLHRYGDTYAHTRLDSFTPESINLDNYSDPLKLAEYIKEWKDISGTPMKRIVPWIIYLNHYIKIYGYGFLTDIDLQKKYLKGLGLVGYLHNIYINQPADKLIMYGNSHFTDDHNATDGSLPDFIFIRPDWYLTYVKNLAVLLSYKYNLQLNKLEIPIFERMVKFASDNKCSLKGIIDYEISKKLKKKYFYIPVYYSEKSRLAATIDALKTDYVKVAKDVLKNTKQYLTFNGIKNYKVIEIKGSQKINLQGFFDILAYKIEIL